MTRILIKIVPILILSVICASCERTGTISTLSFDETPIISQNDRFALILDPYVSLRDAPGDSGITISHARRGDVHEVTGVKLLSSSGEADVWFKLSGGWITASSVSLYSSRQKALRVAETLVD